jgi:hypothetical protein
MSELTFAEIDSCPEPKRTFMRGMIANINIAYVEQTEESERLAYLYFELGGLPPKSRNDAVHIAIATVHECDIILSWNFKHIVNLRAITAVESVNIKEGYRSIRILSPTMMNMEDNET